MKKNQIQIGAFLNYAQIIVGIVVNIVITPVIIKLLGQSEYGIYNLAGSTIVYLNLLTLGIGSAYIKFNIKYRASNDTIGESKFNGTCIYLYAFMSLIVVIAGFVLIYYSNNIFGTSLTVNEMRKTQEVMLVSVLDMAISLPFSIFNMNIQAYEKYVFSNTLNIMNTVLNPLIRLPIVILGGKAVSITIGMSILHLLSCVCSMIYAIKFLNMKFIFGKLDWNIMKGIFGFSFFLLLNQIIDMINWNVDKLILGVVGGTKAVAIYSVGATFNSYTLQFSTAISSVLRTRVHKLVAIDPSLKKVEELFIKAGQIQCIIVSFIILSFFSFGEDFIINFYAGQSYNQAYIIALLLIIPLFIPLIQNTGIEILYALNKYKFRTYLYCVIAICNTIATVPLTIKYGCVGGAFATCVSLIIGNGLIMNIYYSRVVGLDIKKFWKNIFKLIPGMIAPLLVGIYVKYYVNLDTIGIFLLYAIIFSVAYFCSVFVFSLNHDEKYKLVKFIFSHLHTMNK